MKKRVSLICVLIMLLVLTSVASATQAPPETFRIEGRTKLIDLTSIPFAQVESKGKVRGDIKGKFTMDETVMPLNNPPTLFANSGTISIKGAKKSSLSIYLEGDSDLEAVSGIFEVLEGTGTWAGLNEATGEYDGIVDDCTVRTHPCDPYTDPTCLVFKPKCPGFWVDFTFTPPSP